MSRQSKRVQKERKRADLHMVIAFCYETIDMCRKKLAKLENEDGQPTPQD